jgi:mannose-6-phosphate isomerase-like protein (cupin superfamily)
MGPGTEYFHPVSARRALAAGRFSAVLLMASGISGGKLSLVEHPLAPRALGSPVHTHSHEDEYSYILAGQVGIQVGRQVILAGPGDVLAKPRGVPHAFWNAAMSRPGCWRSSRRAGWRTISPGSVRFSPATGRRIRPPSRLWRNSSGSRPMPVPSPGWPPSMASGWAADRPAGRLECHASPQEFESAILSPPLTRHVSLPGLGRSVAELLMPSGWAAFAGEGEQVPQRFDGADVAGFLPGIEGA